MAESSPIDRDEVLRIAKMANLDLTDEEITRMTRDLGGILSYVQKLSEVRLENVAPTAHGKLEQIPLREDEPRPSLPVELALREAPRVLGQGFSVPAFVDEG